MIPTEEQSKQLWDLYQLPEKKRIHVTWVAKVAMFLAERVKSHVSGVMIDTDLLKAGSLLHDIDKNVPRLPGEMHPQTAVRILTEQGMSEVAELITYHSVQYIEQEQTAPKTWEEKILFLSDKMVKQEVITVDKRFDLWLAETDLPEDQKSMLRRVYPKVKALEQEIFSLVGIAPEEVVEYM